MSSQSRNAQRRILITGGAGFIGRSVTTYLQFAGHWVRWLDNLDPQSHAAADAGSPNYCDQANEMILGDVRVREDWERALDGIDAVIHLAAQTGTGQSMYRVAYYTDVNVAGTALLWDLLANERRKISRVVIASSRSIYGEGAYECAATCGTVVPEPRSKEQLQAADWEPHCPICGGIATAVATSEDSAPHPASLYACTKLAQESISLTMGKALGVPTVVLRLQNVYGPGQSLNNPYTGIISIFSNQLRQNLPVNIYEDGRESRDFVYVDDAASACAEALDMTGTPIVLNVGSGRPTRLIDLAKALKNSWDSDSDIAVSGDYRIGDIRHNWADTTRLSRHISGWTARSLLAGLEQFVEWAKQQAEFTDRSLVAADELRERGLGQ